jgi:DNA modification methylase
VRCGIERLTPDRRNANRGTLRGRALLEDSLRRYGAGRSILADKHGNVIAGNKTLEASADIGLPVRFVQTDGTELVVVQRTDLDLDADPTARQLAYADNRIAQLDLDWDAEALLADQAAGIDLAAVGFDPAELAALLAPLDGTTGLTDPDAVPPVPSDPITRPGDLWMLGRHRLLCGDSTVATDVERLLGGATPELLVTDPPYGVEYDAAWRSDLAEQGLLAYAARRVGAVPNDNRADWQEAWALSPSTVVYCWHDALRGGEVQACLEAVGYETRNQIVWSKSNFPISRGHYHWRHEACWYLVRKGAGANWIGDRKQTTVWDVNLDPNVAGGHSTQKPVECMARPLRNHAGDVYDPFLGSGTTLIAAEMHGRTCYGMEISPAYCDVIVKRWEQFTGGQAVRDGT